MKLQFRVPLKLFKKFETEFLVQLPSKMEYWGGSFMIGDELSRITLPKFHFLEFGGRQGGGHFGLNR
jgi:hypothetical protein